MDPSIPLRISDEMIAVVVCVMGICGIVLPAIVFTMAWKWSESQPDRSAGPLAGAVAVCIISILTGGTIVLALLGWLPSPR